MAKVSKALIILPGDRTNKINFPFSLRVFKCGLWWWRLVYFRKSCNVERKANRSDDTGTQTNGGCGGGHRGGAAADEFIITQTHLGAGCNAVKAFLTRMWILTAAILQPWWIFTIRPRCFPSGSTTTERINAHCSPQKCDAYSIKQLLPGETSRQRWE